MLNLLCQECSLKFQAEAFSECPQCYAIEGVVSVDVNVGDCTCCGKQGVAAYQGLCYACHQRDSGARCT